MRRVMWFLIVRRRLYALSCPAACSSTGIPNGSEVDATDGRVPITVATGHTGRTASAEAYGGVFAFRQTRAAHTLARLALSLPLTGCPRRLLTGRSKSRARGAKHRSGSKSRHLWGPESGGYLVRQSGVIDPGSSSGAAVAIVAFAPSFAAGTEMLTRTASWLSHHLQLSSRPSAGCTSE